MRTIELTAKVSNLKPAKARGVMQGFLGHAKEGELFPWGERPADSPEKLHPYLILASDIIGKVLQRKAKALACYGLLV